ncbi:hypothetical protein E1176_02015 [Fulvivirga sp. RKSG066]|uniref:hypothetical protein n=1 Tax=Fulvivirga aurantia TaxID=2529383 RepID=UPI0012BC2B31|nr:hypothetical protein [Fulvivirga aurantia]MTI19788.1 hypothetical protein [Fulvivirga aurantia]
MRHFIYPLTIFISSVLISCNKTIDKPIIYISDIEFPLVSDFQSNDSLTFQAWKEVKNYLTKKDEPLDSMFITGTEYDSSEQFIVFYVTHFDSFLLKRKLEIQDSINEANSNTDYNWAVPPTGNWSGHDRTMIFRIQDEELSDLLVQ